MKTMIKQVGGGRWFGVAALGLAAVMPASGGDLAFSDPARIPAPPSHAIGFPSRAPDLDVWPGFQSPPPGYGEVGFYWWLGDPLTRERLTWQLDQLARVEGVMGLQINYAHTDRGGLSYGLTFPSDPPLFSPAWWELVGWFMGEARQRGMAVSLSDYTLGLGQGWTVDQALKDHPDLEGAVLQAETRESPGGQPCTWDLGTPPLSLTALSLDTAGANPEAPLDLRDRVRDGRLEWTPPPGRWRIVAVRVQPVVPSLDPMHPRSGEIYARTFFGQFTDRHPEEAGRGLNWFFSDELEFRVAGNLWNGRFAEEFRRRKGYDLEPELAALFTDIGPRTPKIRLDYSDVKVALTEEGFFKPVFDWHQQRGMIYGCDHGGRGRNVIEFGDYFRTQRWNQGPGCDQPGLGRDVIKNKVASSIAHLYQRPRVWLEGYYGSGWGTSSEQLTDATLVNFVQGQNLLTLHGLYYATHGGWWEWAPPCNHFRMPYWPHLKTFFACTRRLSYLLSQGDHRCDTAILYPVAPMEAGLGGEESVRTAFGLGEHLYRQGMDFDFMDFESLDRARIEAGELRVSGERYRALVLPAMRAIRWSTLEKAVAFHRAGGHVVLLGAVPEASDRTGRADATLDALVAELPRRTTTAEQVAAQLGEALGRDFDCPGAGTDGARPAVMHRRIGNRDVYAVHGAPEGAEATLRATGRVELWDPWTGSASPLPVVSQENGRTRLRMPLTEREVQLIVFSPGQAALAPASAAPPAAPEVIALSGPWEFELQPTLDNRFGDFRWPPTPTLIGAEARRFRYADETAADPGWESPAADDSRWPVVTASFGPGFWKLGPLPEGAEVAALEAQLAALETVDPTVPVVWNGRQWPWQPQAFSWRWGIEGDPGHQGWHGLKEVVPDEFIGLGRLRLSGTGTSYEKEPDGGRYYLWTSATSTTAQEVRATTLGTRPAAVWVNHQRLDPGVASANVKEGANPLLLRYDQPGRAAYVLHTGEVPPPAPAGSLRMRWDGAPGVLPFDTRPQETQPAGWYRFLSPPGMKALDLVARGQVRIWADGRECTVTPATPRADGTRSWRAVVAQPAAGAVVVAVRIAQERGTYAGAALPEPIALECDTGTAALGDWTQQGVLECYSGGAWYRRQFTLDATQAARPVTLDLGNLASSAEVRVNGRSVGVRVAPPWRYDLTGAVQAGENRIEVLVLSALGGHYTTIPTRYRGSLVSGLLGPVTVNIHAAADGRHP